MGRTVRRSIERRRRIPNDRSAAVTASTRLPLDRSAAANASGRFFRASSVHNPDTAASDAADEPFDPHDAWIRAGAKVTAVSAFAKVWQGWGSPVHAQGKGDGHRATRPAPMRVAVVSVFQGEGQSASKWGSSPKGVPPWPGMALGVPSLATPGGFLGSTHRQ